MTEESQRVNPLSRTRHVDRRIPHRPTYLDRRRDLWCGELSEDGKHFRLTLNDLWSLSGDRDEEKEREGSESPNGPLMSAQEISIELKSFAGAFQTKVAKHLYDIGEQDRLQHTLQLAKTWKEHPEEAVLRILRTLKGMEETEAAVRFAGDVGRDLVCPIKLAEFVRQHCHANVPVHSEVEGVKVKLVADLLRKKGTPALIVFDTIIFDFAFFKTASEVCRQLIFGHEMGHFIQADSSANLGELLLKKLSRASGGNDSRAEECRRDLEIALLKVSRQDELQADLHSVAFAQRMGHSQEQIKRGIDTLICWDETPSEGKTHPNGRERREALYSYLTGIRL